MKGEEDTRQQEHEKNEWGDEKEGENTKEQILQEHKKNHSALLQRELWVVGVGVLRLVVTTTPPTENRYNKTKKAAMIFLKS